MRYLYLSAFCWVCIEIFALGQSMIVFDFLYATFFATLKVLWFRTKLDLYRLPYRCFYCSSFFFYQLIGSIFSLGIYEFTKTWEKYDLRRRFECIIKNMMIFMSFAKNFKKRAIILLGLRIGSWNSSSAEKTRWVLLQNDKEAELETDLELG